MDAKDILKKYSYKIESELGNVNESEEYKEFKQESIKDLSSYERWANSLGNLISIKVSYKDKVKQEKYIKDAHISVTPQQVITLSMISFLLILFLTVISTIAIFFFTEKIQFTLLILGGSSGFVLLSTVICSKDTR